MKLGHEFAGEVVKLGPGVKRLKVGDRVSAIPFALTLGSTTRNKEPLNRQSGKNRYQKRSLSLCPQARINLGETQLTSDPSFTIIGERRVT